MLPLHLGQMKEMSEVAQSTTMRYDEGEDKETRLGECLLAVVLLFLCIVLNGALYCVLA